MAVYNREKSKVALPQLEARVKALEENAPVIFSTVLSDSFTTSTYTTVTAKIPVKKGYTASVVGAYPYGDSGSSGYGYCNLYNVGINSSGYATCGVRYLGSSSATAYIRFRIAYTRKETA